MLCVSEDRLIYVYVQDGPLGLLCREEQAECCFPPADLNSRGASRENTVSEHVLLVPPVEIQANLGLYCNLDWVTASSSVLIKKVRILRTKLELTNT